MKMGTMSTLYPSDNHACACACSLGDRARLAVPRVRALLYPIDNLNSFASMPDVALSAYRSASSFFPTMMIPRTLFSGYFPHPAHVPEYLTDHLIRPLRLLQLHHDVIAVDVPAKEI